MAERGDAARGLVHGFLRGVAGVAFDPLPLNLVRGGSFIKPRPPFMVRLATEASRHCFDDVARIGQKTHAAWLAQLFEADGSGGNLRLLIRRRSQIETESAPNVAVAEQRDRRRAWRCLPIAET